MKRTATILAVLATLAAAPSASAAEPFYGVVPQTALNQAETDRMVRGGLRSLRISVQWYAINGSQGSFNWSGIDPVIKLAARSGLEVLPFLYGTPGWVAPRAETLPVNSARQRRAWAAFMRSAVQRYGPGGSFWSDNPTLPVRPIRKWQVWNEENFFYFTKPASPGRYGQLLKVSARALRAVDPGARVILGGLFGDPRQRPPRAMDATDFLNRLYRVNGIKAFFDGVALHPYAGSARQLKPLVEGLRRVIVRNGDRRTPLYITEMGWGSQANSPVSFEKGLRGQARELRRAYSYLRGNRRRLNVRQVFWYAWKDAPASPCSFCDSVGLFRRGNTLRPKPAWYSLVRFTGGDPSAGPSPSQEPIPVCDTLPLPC